MSSHLLSPAARPRGLSRIFVVPLFATTLFLSAFLLFGVQPMLAKMVLPVLGGSPSVWSVAMVFFQAALLAGYAYAHVLTRYLPPRPAALLHLTIMAAVVSMLPIALARGWGAPPQDSPALWLFGFFAASVGLPFVAVAANGPLLQAWFARSDHPQARDPYLLYGASNVGSFVALLAYPFVVEPLLPLTHQARIWSALFVVLGGGIVCCAALVSGRSGESTPASVPSTAARPLLWRTRLSWLALAFVPSGLLVSVTAHLSTDVAAAPLLWIVPLAIFLLTFVAGFRARAVITSSKLGVAQIWLGAFALMNLEARSPLPVTLLVHLGLFAASALMCHRALYERRPAPERLTDFYLTIALGGVLGGAFAALLAPVLFSSIVEYPLLMVAALFCQPTLIATLRHAGPRAFALPAVCTAAVMALGWYVAGRWASADHVRIAVVVLICAGALLTWREPARAVAFLAGGALAIVAYGGLIAPRDTFRSFFGVMKVREMIDGQFRILEHGTTLHGAMRIREPDGAPYAGPVQPTTYYTPEGPLGTVFASVRAARGALGHVSVIGLGVGAMACHMRPGEALTFYEIDPLVVRIATDPAKFRFLSDCAPDAGIVVGDARLTLAAASRASDLLLVDAFSSDAIPVHLLTREAIALYRNKLTANGVLVLHISNQHLDLRKLVARTAAELGLRTYIRDDDSNEAFETRLRTASTVAAIVRDDADLGPIAKDARWVRMPSEPDRRPWTDDFSSILEPLIDRYRP